MKGKSKGSTPSKKAKINSGIQVDAKIKDASIYQIEELWFNIFILLSAKKLIRLASTTKFFRKAIFSNEFGRMFDSKIKQEAGSNLATDFIKKMNAGKINTTADLISSYYLYCKLIKLINNRTIYQANSDQNLILFKKCLTSDFFFQGVLAKKILHKESIPTILEAKQYYDLGVPLDILKDDYLKLIQFNKIESTPQMPEADILLSNFASEFIQKLTNENKGLQLQDAKNKFSSTLKEAFILTSIAQYYIENGLPCKIEMGFISSIIFTIKAKVDATFDRFQSVDYDCMTVNDNLQHPAIEALLSKLSTLSGRELQYLKSKFNNLNLVIIASNTTISTEDGEFINYNLKFAGHTQFEFFEKLIPEEYLYRPITDYSCMQDAILIARKNPGDFLEESILKLEQAGVAMLTADECTKTTALTLQSPSILFQQLINTEVSRESLILINSWKSIYESHDHLEVREAAEQILTNTVCRTLEDYLPLLSHPSYK